MIINCKECNSQISDKAGACPSCGFPLKEQQKEKVVVVEKNKEGCFLKTLNCGCMIILILFILFAVIAPIISKILK